MDPITAGEIECCARCCETAQRGPEWVAALRLLHAVFCRVPNVPQNDAQTGRG